MGPGLLGLRAVLERRHLDALRERTGPITVTDEPVDRQLTALIAADDGPSLSSYMAKQGTLEQWREYLTLRSVYHLKEGDPHTFAIPRLGGRAKAAMVEIQADEYGGGSLVRMHSELFGGLMRDLDLDSGLRRALGRRPRGRVRLGQHDVLVRAASPLAGCGGGT